MFAKNALIIITELNDFKKILLSGALKEADCRLESNM